MKIRANNNNQFARGLGNQQMVVIRPVYFDSELKQVPACIGEKLRFCLTFLPTRLIYSCSSNSFSISFRFAPFFLAFLNMLILSLSLSTLYTSGWNIYSTPQSCPLMISTFISRLPCDLFPYANQAQLE